MTYPKGMDWLQQNLANRPSNSDSNFVRKLWVKSGETAKFWFLTDGDQAVFANIHGVNAGKQFPVDIACQRITDDQPESDCYLCVDTTGAVTGRFLRMLMYVYVERIAHLSPRQGQDWKQQGKFFIEEANDTRLLIAKTRLQKTILDEYIGVADPFAEGEAATETKVHSLLNHPYTITKTGTGTETRETLKAGEEVSKLPEAVANATKELGMLPSLDELVQSEFADRRQGSGNFDPGAFSKIASGSDSELSGEIDL